MATSKLTDWDRKCLEEAGTEIALAELDIKRNPEWALEKMKRARALIKEVRTGKPPED